MNMVAREALIMFEDLVMTGTYVITFMTTTKFCGMDWLTIWAAERNQHFMVAIRTAQEVRSNSITMDTILC